MNTTLTNKERSFRHAPNLNERTRRRLLLCDATTLNAGALLVALFADFQTDAPAGSVLTAFVTGLWLFLVFDWLGLHRRSHAKAARDEFYYVAVAVLFAGLPALALTLLPGLSNDRWVVFATLLAGLVAAGCTRASIYPRQERERRTRDVAEDPTQLALSAPSRMTLAGKRAIDIALAAVALVLFIPIMLVAAFAIILESGRPIIFEQERVGRDDSSFNIMKFRSMRADSGTEWARPGDDRITRVGAFLRRSSIDELPQVINVLKGEMSLVGPRPETRQYSNEFTNADPNYALRHLVRPGITGWSQVHMKRNLQPSDMPAIIEHDLYYVRNCSVYLDLVIILKTALEFPFHRAV